MYEIRQALLKISEDINEIKSKIAPPKNSSTDKLKGEWIDGQDVLLALNISKRTLQTLRDSKKLPYSRINGKFYYKVSDIEALLEKNYRSNLSNWIGDEY
ncbi:MAG: helix-turn-helix domain-containing protein [Bacteroidales bacterium]|nr:helix-turn-helix domain-containing protein [Bacteroidales bacterium]